MSISIEKGANITPLTKTFKAFFIVLAALTLGSILFIIAGVNPFKAYITMIGASFGSLYGFSEVLVRATPITLCGLSVAFAAKMLLWNIGAEGQLVMGGIFSAGVALFLSEHIPSFTVIPVMVIAGCVGGGIWASIPAVLKYWKRVDEVLTSLLLNYVAIFLFQNLYYVTWRDPAGRGFPGTAKFPGIAFLPRFFGTRVHLGLVFAVFSVFLIYFIFSYTKWGYEIRVSGESTEAARYAKIKINRNMVLVMFFSGALAGIAGMSEASGIHFRLMEGLASGYGYTGILVAFLSKLNPFLVLTTSILFGALIFGGDHLQVVAQIPSAISTVIQSIILLSVLFGALVTRYRINVNMGGER